MAIMSQLILIGPKYLKNEWITVDTVLLLRCEMGFTDTHNIWRGVYGETLTASIAVSWVHRVLIILFHFLNIKQVFSRYEKHRQLVLEDIFASLARLPSSKKNLRNFR